VFEVISSYQLCKWSQT